MMIMLSSGMGCFILEVKKRAMSRQLNAYFDILNIETSFGSFHAAVIYKPNAALSERPAIFQATARIFQQTVKFPPFISRK